MSFEFKDFSIHNDTIKISPPSSGIGNDWVLIIE
ncbi:hypothetical protein [Arthrospiribacter ruber]|uniref:Uncharacterized protein n=1 Tax=Arthrospiribacter ruber TaxID=2487934 RepID=A0A951M8B2_9BACT|nr:hypothetical protein [Arthrospiribacter ruber]